MCLQHHCTLCYIRTYALNPSCDQMNWKCVQITKSPFPEEHVEVLPSLRIATIWNNDSSTKERVLVYFSHSWIKQYKDWASIVTVHGTFLRFQFLIHRIVSIQVHCRLKESRGPKGSLAAFTLRVSIQGAGGRFEARSSCVLACQAPGVAEDGIQSKAVPWPEPQTGVD